MTLQFAQKGAKKKSVTNAIPQATETSQNAQHQQVINVDAPIDAKSIRQLQHTHGNHYVRQLLQTQRSQDKNSPLAKSVKSHPIKPISVVQVANVQRQGLIQRDDDKFPSPLEFENLENKPEAVSGASVLNALGEIYGNISKLRNQLFASDPRNPREAARIEGAFQSVIESNVKDCMVAFDSYLSECETNKPKGLFKSDAKEKHEKHTNAAKKLRARIQSPENEFKKIVTQLEKEFVTRNQQRDAQEMGGFYNMHSSAFLDPNNALNFAENAASGGMNTLHKGTFNLPPSKQSPAGSTLTGYIKYDKPGNSDPAQAAGISSANPKAALRGVATYELSQLMDLGIIPKTAPLRKPGAKPEYGQVMEEVTGMAGQEKVDKVEDYETSHLREVIEKQTAILNRKDPPPTLQEKRRAEEILGRYKIADIGGKKKIITGKETAPVDFDWDNPVLQERLSTLQVFDLIIGHIDRHAGNYIIKYKKNSPMPEIEDVQGIDNDDVFPEFYTDAIQQEMQHQNDKFRNQQGNNNKISKTPGMPPVVDFKTASNVLAMDFTIIEKKLTEYTMTPEEIDATRQRFTQVQKAIAERVRDNKIASSGPVDQAKLDAMLANAARILNTTIPATTLQAWGASTAALNTASNSYAGKQKDMVANSRSRVPVK